MQTVGLIGLGALGVMFGWELQKNLKDHFYVIVDAERKRQYKSGGIFSNGEICQFNYVTPEQCKGPLDLVIFGTKIAGLKAAMETARVFIGPNTVIISILNGVSSEELLGEAFGKEKVLYAVAQEMDAIREGNSVRFKNMGCILYGEPNGEMSQRVFDVESLLKRGGVVGRPSSDAKRILWNKLMINVGVNQTSAAFGATYGEIINKPELRCYFEGGMREAMEIARKEGVNLNEEDMKKWIAAVEKLDPNSYPSMRQDILAKRHTELDLFGRTIVRLGLKHNIPTPINEMFVEKISDMEKAF